ncbi:MULTISPECIES: tRNA dihydrouridine(20/20a) synthase DusA [unclassified Gilliamella]|uniref:tRNA dihydrouridine(20/20a) synthase DusA n=1 Tax=unclassified Gilliamella TaxID=2685620 RepID=UPI002269DF29|nr:MULTISPECIES: tRNA dihydrouridine(20/20a) synthase DusA [unclassified Gilliamella]MCX8574506.1 tRNA dihydrouridine(20/20a) synthase DusA [Gilliamella sp. B3831]MCX8576737.1 tRNA dihydrouridine(20/20a) synthase DusA [Gilliamella sp. B3815]MCX8589281.1 tRNA dihydrouridine(20/20a) synthase DusA [Gilliamella sp. B3812]MCX8603855.1 tRNA dihydrouridine(20/20a) synthase DusA [Gilliamella sp. B3823]MCX8606735.1 tRNA dihydrouridine(20/20a) synthase DusA [Gilliamella sp. B3825]
MNSTLNKFSIAPMLDWTDKHCRYFHRILTKQTLLYTEMVTTGAILFGKGNYLDFNVDEHPIALQLGGSDPNALAQCAKLAQNHGYDEVNLNVGCPSDRVQNGMFGACLMGNADLVAKCIESMQEQIDIPVTVKTRIGIDDLDSYAFLCQFIETVLPYTNTFIVHARKAWLSGLSPKENREVPPLDYERVYQLKRDYPNLTIAINGGVKTIDEIKHHLNYVDGVMVGREAYQNPMLLAHIDSQIFGLDTQPIDPIAAIRCLYPYIEQQLLQGAQLNHIMRHTLGIFNGQKGAKQWRRYLSENAYKKGAGIEVVEHALNFIQ